MAAGLNTIRPNGVSGSLGSGWVRTGGASDSGAQSDSSDATYHTVSGSGSSAATLGTFTLGTFTLAAGQRVKRVRPSARMSTSGVGYGAVSLWVEYSTSAAAAANVSALSTTWSDKAGTWTVLPGSGTQQTLLDGLKVAAHGQSGSSDPRIADLWVTVEVWERTSAPTVSSPAASVTNTDRPEIDWTIGTVGYGTPSSWSHQVRVFTSAVYGGGGFDPDTSEAIWETSRTGQSASTPGEDVIPDVLSNGTYRAYVKVGKEDVDGETLWSTWGYRQFTVSVTVPGAPGLLTFDVSPSGYNQIDCDPVFKTHDTVVSCEIERSDDGGTTWSRIRGGLVTTFTGPASNPDLFTVYDYEAPRDVAVQYRARVNEQITGSPSTIASAWTTDTSFTHTSDGTTWMYDVPTFTNVVGDVPVHIGSQWERPEQVGVFRPIGRTTAVVVSASSALPWDVTLTVESWDNDDLDALLATPTTILVKFHDGTQRYLRAVRRTFVDLTVADCDVKQWTVDMVEVDEGF